MRKLWQKNCISRYVDLSLLPKSSAPIFIIPESVQYSLVLFNILFFWQTSTDMGVFTGGASLPKGISFSAYATQGAYPLLFAAISIGLFSMAANKIVSQSKTLKVMHYALLAQALFLVITATRRLSLYVEAYSLTYLRLYAFIWMGLVFVGLILTLVQIARNKPLAWLIRSNLLVELGVLYLCSFVDFSYRIASYNINAAATVEEIDWTYICDLEESVGPLIKAHSDRPYPTICPAGSRARFEDDPPRNWRAWEFRNWRMRQSLEREQQGGG